MCPPFMMKVSDPRSWFMLRCVSTSCTPGTASAAMVSTRVIRPRATVLSVSAAYAVPAWPWSAA